jgi:hypothetical protein
MTFDIEPLKYATKLFEDGRSIEDTTTIARELAEKGVSGRYIVDVLQELKRLENASKGDLTIN